MRGSIPSSPGRQHNALDRALAVFADVRAGEGLTALLMLANIFLLLVCYSIIKTVREPLILLGGGAEVRSYAAAGQAILLMGFVPLYSWVASKVRRMTLVIGATVFFIACIELFSAAVMARVPYVGVAFFVWVGIFNISLVAQFWSFANDLYSKESGARLFPLIVIGMTAGAPIGSLAAGRLFHSGLAPELILQASAVLLSVTAGLYLLVNARETAQGAAPQEPMPGPSGFALVLANPYLRLIAALIVLLNVVNTTGEYLVARLLSVEVQQLAAAHPLFDKQAYIGAFSGTYQFWVGVTALLLQAFVTSRLVRQRGLAGVLLALPLIALGGYAIVAAGAGFALVRWVKTAENAADYSIMNTARQMLWLPTTREEKYKAKQAIDTFFVRGGDVLSAGVVYAGTHVLHLDVPQFALVNLALTLVWLGMAMKISRPEPRAHAPRRWAAAMAAVIALVVAPSQASGQTLARDAADLRAVMVATAREARAESRFPGCRNERVLPFKNLFSATFGDLKRLPTTGNAGILAIGGGAALLSHPADKSVTKTFSSSEGLEETLESGAVLGGFPLQIGGAFLTYGLGRAFKNDCMAAVGGELVQAQFVAQVLTYGIKGSVRRPRPEGGGFSFPSGHTTAAFASATVLQRHFGWKVGIPAYGAATYVAAQRVQGKRHYLSDVAFGAALGVVAGRTVTMPGGHKMSLGAIPTDFGPAAGLTLLGKN